MSDRFIVTLITRGQCGVVTGKNVIAGTYVIAHLIGSVKRFLQGTVHSLRYFRKRVDNVTLIFSCNTGGGPAHAF